MSITDDQLVAATPRRDPEPGDVGGLDEPSEVRPDEFLLELGAEVRRAERKAAILEEQGRRGRAAKVRKKAAKARRKLVRAALTSGAWRTNRDLTDAERTQVALTLAPVEESIEDHAPAWPTPDNPMVEFPPEPVEAPVAREPESDTLVLTIDEVEAARQAAAVEAEPEIDLTPVAEEPEPDEEELAEAEDEDTELGDEPELDEADLDEEEPELVQELPAPVAEIPVGASALVARIGAYTAFPERVAV